MYRSHKPFIVLMVAILTIAVLGFAAQPVLAAPSRDGDHPERDPCCKSPDECFPPCQSKDMPGVHILTGPDKHCYLNEDHERDVDRYYYPGRYGYYPRVYGCAGYTIPRPPRRVYYTQDCDCRHWDSHKKPKHGYYPYSCNCSDWDYHKPSYNCYYHKDCSHQTKYQHKKSSRNYQVGHDGCWIGGRFTTYCRHKSYSSSSTKYWYMRNGVWVQQH